MKEEGFLAALASDPDDDMTRLVYADWLEENGDPRSEYLRLLVSIDQLGDPGQAEVQRWIARLLEVQEPLDPAWIGLVNRKRISTAVLYRSQAIDDYWYYLRFSEDGIVLDRCSTSGPEEMWVKFAEGSDAQSSDLARGCYAISGPAISFSTACVDGVVEYNGTVFEGVLTVAFHSHINGHRDILMYYPFGCDRADQGDEP